MNNQNVIHQPVLIDQLIAMLKIKPTGKYVDATVGDGGHALALLRCLTSGGFVYGLDQDPIAIKTTQNRLVQAGFKNFRLFCINFMNLKQCLNQIGVSKVDGIIFDLGLSSAQLASSDRGFSYHHDGPLDMRMSDHQVLTAADLIQNSSEQALVTIFQKYGEIRNARRLAHYIVKTRCQNPILTTKQLVRIVKQTVPSRWSRIGHPARKLFQALRIAVNNEVEALKQGLVNAKQLLARHGRLLVISFHSIEDRIVKHYFRSLVTVDPQQKLCKGDLPFLPGTPSVQFRLLNRRPLMALKTEVLANHRARSAKLRGIERI